jgi:hypothetical protein
MLVALIMWGWIERRRYLNEHVYLRVLDKATSVPIPSFEYRTSIITQHSGIELEWSEWKPHSSPSMLSMKVPQHCRLHVDGKYELRCPNDVDSLLIETDGMA